MISISVLIAFSIAIITVVNNSYINEKKRDMYRQANTIAISLVTTGYFEDNQDISYLSTIQASVNGRAVIADSQGYVLYDTSYLDTGKTLSTGMIIEAIQGNSSFTHNEDINVGIVVVPIHDLESGGYHGAIQITDSFQEITESIQNILYIMLMGSLILILIIGVLSYVMSNNFTKPFHVLIQHMDSVSQGYMDEIKISSSKEIEDIATAFNKMICKLKDVEQNRQTFVANVSHELKTPLSSMKVLSESLLLQPDTPIEIYRDFMQDIDEEINRETKIINDLLTLVTLDVNEIELHYEKVHVNSMVESILRRLKPLADEKRISIYFETNREVETYLDRTKMELVITNLVENAIKYNKEQGYIDVKLQGDHKQVRIEVKDTGEGIPEESIDKVFQRFYRVDKNRSRNTGGTGLGLSIVKQTVLMHKGTVRCESEIGKWTKFIVTLPITN